MTKTTDSSRYCHHHMAWGDHHTDRGEAMAEFYKDEEIVRTQRALLGRTVLDRLAKRVGSKTEERVVFGRSLEDDRVKANLEVFVFAAPLAVGFLLCLLAFPAFRSHQFTIVTGVLLSVTVSRLIQLTVQVFGRGAHLNRLDRTEREMTSRNTLSTNN